MKIKYRLASDNFAVFYLHKRAGIGFNFLLDFALFEVGILLFLFHLNFRWKIKKNTNM
jgi:hypothetical protein